MLEGGVPSSSRTDSPIVTLVSWFEYWRTIIFVSSIPSLYSSVEASRGRLRSPPIGHSLCEGWVAIARQELDGVGRHAVAGICGSYYYRGSIVEMIESRTITHEEGRVK
jgi:hypothetical protein